MGTVAPDNRPFTGTIPPCRAPHPRPSPALRCSSPRLAPPSPRRPLPPPTPPPLATTHATPASPALPPPGALVSRRDGTTGRALLSWSETPGAAGYDIEVTGCPGAPCRFESASVRAHLTAPRFALPRAGLPPGPLAFRSRACDAAAHCGAWSEAAIPARRPAYDFDGDGIADLCVAPRLPPATARGVPVIPRAQIEDLRHLRVFPGGPQGPHTPRKLDAPDTQQCAPGVCCLVLGSALGAGDLDGDGYPDLVVAGTTFCPAAPDAIIVYRGSHDGLSQTPTQVITGPAAADFGHAVAVGDVDGDGLADVIVGAPHDRVDGVRAGAIYVYRGSPTGLSTTPTRTANPRVRRGADFGVSVAVIGDMDGDGIAELAVGAVDTTYDTHDAGAVYLFTGGKDLHLVGTPLTDSAGGRDARFGYDVIGSDVDGDGLADLLVDSALDFSTVFGPPLDATYPAVSVFPGVRAAAPGAPRTHHARGRANWNRLAAAGDVNADGFDDFVVSRPYVQSANKVYYVGDVQLYLGGPSGPSEAPTQTIPGRDRTHGTHGCTNVNGSIGFGERIAGVGDVNGDGFDDIAAICTGTDRTLVFTGSAHGLSETPLVALDIEGVMLGGRR